MEAQARLKAIESTTDGFKIAEADLEIRGPGQYFGRHQHGLNELRFANPLTQMDILQLARSEAEELTHTDPQLAEPAHQILAEIIKKRYPDYLSMATAG
jgi:ATP-dependent DNA helicase RecG